MGKPFIRLVASHGCVLKRNKTLFPALYIGIGGQLFGRSKEPPLIVADVCKLAKHATIASTAHLSGFGLGQLPWSNMDTGRVAVLASAQRAECNKGARESL